MYLRFSASKFGTGWPGLKPGPTNSKYSAGLFLGDGDGRSRGFPVEVHGATVGRLVEGDGEVFYRGGQAGRSHVHADEVTVCAGIGRTPFAGFFADNQGPFVFVGNGEERVAAGGDRFAAYREVGVGDEGGGFVGAGAPDLAVGNQTAVNLAAFGARAGVIDGKGFAAAEVAGSLCGRAGARLLFLCGAHADEGAEDQGANCYEHGKIFHWIFPSKTCGSLTDR